MIIGIRKPRASTFKIWSLNYSTHCRKCAVCRLIRKPLGFKDIAGSFEFCTLNNKGLTPYGRFVQNTLKSNFHLFFSISSYLKCGSNWFRFLSTIEKKYASKIHRKKRKFIIIIFYWSHVQVQLINTHNNENYDNNLVFEHFGDQNWVLRNRSI